MSWRTIGCRRAVHILAVAVSGALFGACNLIAGIDEGTLVDASVDGAPRNEAGTKRDATSGGDAPGLDGGPDAHATDARARDTGRSADAGTDVALRPLTCSPIGKPTLVEDLTAFASPDSGVLSYGAGPYVEPLVGGGFFIVSQINDDNTEFFLYEAQNLESSSVNRVVQSGATDVGSNIRLLDVETTASGTSRPSVNALISYSFPITGGPPENGLQVVPLPVTYPGGATGNPYNFQFASGEINNTQLADIPPNDAGLTMAYATSAEALGSTFALDLGTTGPSLEGGAGPIEIHKQSGQIQGGNSGLFAVGNSLYYLASGWPVDAGVDGGLLEYALSDNGDGGLVGWISPPASPKWGLLAAKRSSRDPSKVILVAAAADTSGMPLVDVYSAIVDPSTIHTLTVDKPPFHRASSLLPSTSAPINPGGSSAWYGDDFIRISATADQSGIVVLWLGASGEIVAFGQAPIVTTDSTVLSTGVIFDSSGFISDTIGATLDVAWIEAPAADAGALGSQRLFAQRISCVPALGGD